MRHIERNPIPKNKTNPESLDNTRKPEEYKPALVKDHNDRWGKAFHMDPAKVRVLAVRQNSFKPWEATVTLGEDVNDAEGNFLHVNQHSTIITRAELPLGVTKVEREPGETPYATWKKVEQALGLEDNELVAILDLPHNATGAVYKFSETSLNHYGTVRVSFTYSE